VTAAPAFTRFRGLGATAVVGCVEADRLAAAAEAVEAEIDACDRACSRFRPDSELSRLNDPSRDRAGQAASAWLCDALEAAVHVAGQTGGLVDPSIGQCLVDLGYDRSFDLLDPTGPVVVSASHVAAWGRIVVDRGRRWVSVPVGVRLDLGASAKALCADRAAQAACAATGLGVLVSLGGDISVAGAAPAGGWVVKVTDRADNAPDGPEPGQTIAVRAGGLATSGTSARRWRRGGEQLHHLVDPRTSRPAAENWTTVTVAAASCLEANLASSAAMILGAEAPGWLAGRRLDARLVGHDAVELVGDWPTDRGEAQAEPVSR
jgi:thiamine biosynthesis lipoprotein